MATTAASSASVPSARLLLMRASRAFSRAASFSATRRRISIRRATRTSAAPTFRASARAARRPSTARCCASGARMAIRTRCSTRSPQTRRPKFESKRRGAAACLGSARSSRWRIRLFGRRRRVSMSARAPVSRTPPPPPKGGRAHQRIPHQHR
eukprot:2312469-Prymnesium_polylepis.1